MARKPKGGKRKPTTLTIAIEGEGVGLGDIPLRQLAELLETTASTFEAIAAEKNLDPPRLSLVKASKGSAAYALASEDEQAPRVVDGFVSMVRKRGKGSSPKTRRAYGRLHKVGTKTPGGGLRVDPPQKATNAKPKPIILSAPLTEDEPKIEQGTTVFARVVGVKIDAHERATVTLRYDDGGSGEFDADADGIRESAKLIGDPVEARVTFVRSEGQDWAGRIEHIQKRRQQYSLSEALKKARASLAADGVVIDSREWLADIHGEGEEAEGEQTDRGG